MSRILESFKEWKSSVNEQSAPDRIKITNEINQKAIINPIDKSSFKVRTKWTDDMIDANGRLTPTGFNAIMTEIREYVDPATGQATLINYYSGLKDLTQNLVVYDVIRDTDTAKDSNPKIRKQSFKFTIVSRELYPNIPKNVYYIRQGDTPATQSQPAGQTTNVGEVLTNADTFGLDFSRGPVYINNPSDPKMIQLIDSFYFKLSADDTLINVKEVITFRKALSAELKSSRLGDNAKALISALNAAFGLVTRYGDPETGITQTLLQKLKNVKSNAPGANTAGVILSQASGFMYNEFISGLKLNSGIIVPAGGFVKGRVVKNDEFAKFQKLLITKFKKSLGTSKIYKNFARFNIGGADGTYGPNTAALVGLLKAALTDPKWSGNMDKNNVDQAFIDRINQEKVAESYISLDGFTLIVEGIDMGAVDAYEVPSAGNINSEPRVTPVGDKYLLQGKDGYEYFVKDKVWHYKKDGGKLFLVVNPISIKKLNAAYPKAGAFFILTKMDNGKWIRSDKHLYKYTDNVWYVKLNGTGSWQKVEDPTYIKSMYKMNTGSQATDKKIDFSKLDEDFIKLGNSIKKFIEDPTTFESYKGIDDDEDEAWNEVLFPQWQSVWKKELNALYKKVNSIENNELVKKRYLKTIASIKSMFSEGVGDTVVTGNTFYGTFNQGALISDTWKLKLYLGATTVVKTILIETDF